jgi:glycosyltransferase involved in cell wall biosynthesis
MSVESVLSQTFQDFELIIVDDGSDDDTEAVIHTIDDSRVKYIKCDRNYGATHARNVGIQIASGQYVAFQDSDDQWLPEKLRKQVEVLHSAKKNVGVVYNAYWRVINNKQIYMPVDAPNTKKAKAIVAELFFLFVATPTVLVRKECFERSGVFDERLPRLQEWELWIRMSQNYNFEYINEALVASYYQSQSITADHESLIASFDLILEKHGQILYQDKNKLAKIFAIFGRHLLSSKATYNHGRDYLLNAFKLKPTSSKYILYLTFSYLGYGVPNILRKLYRSAKG